MSNVDAYEQSAAAEVPEAPNAAPKGPEVDGNFEDELVALAPNMGEAMPAGTYHFRVDRYTEAWAEEDEKTSPSYGVQPYFMVFWKCQQEPLVGRSFMDFVPWVTKEVFGGARSGDQEAINLIKDRLWKIKAIKKACAYEVPSGNVKDFLNENPECKIKLIVKEDKRPDHKGDMQNQASKYLPLHAV